MTQRQTCVKPLGQNEFHTKKRAKLPKYFLNLQYYSIKILLVSDKNFHQHKKIVLILFVESALMVIFLPK